MAASPYQELPLNYMILDCLDLLFLGRNQASSPTLLLRWGTSLPLGCMLFEHVGQLSAHRSSISSQARIHTSHQFFQLLVVELDAL